MASKFKKPCDNPDKPGCDGEMYVRTADDDHPYETWYCPKCGIRYQYLPEGEGEYYELGAPREDVGTWVSVSFGSVPATVYEFWKNESWGRVEAYALLAVIEVDEVHATDEFPVGKYLHIIRHPSGKAQHKMSSVETDFIWKFVISRISPSGTSVASRNSIKPLAAGMLDRERRTLEREGFVEAPNSPYRGVRVRWTPPGTKTDTVKQPDPDSVLA